MSTLSFRWWSFEVKFLTTKMKRMNKHFNLNSYKLAILIDILTPGQDETPGVCQNWIPTACHLQYHSKNMKRSSSAIIVLCNLEIYRYFWTARQKGRIIILTQKHCFIIFCITLSVKTMWFSFIYNAIKITLKGSDCNRLTLKQFV